MKNVNHALKEGFGKLGNSACSAGVQEYCITPDHNICLCHKFFIKKKARGDMSIIPNNVWVAPIEDNEAQKYSLSSSVYFGELSYNINLMALKVMADVGQISPVYKDEERRKFLALLFQPCFTCRYDNIIRGSIYLMGIEILRMFGYCEMDRYLLGPTDGWTPEYPTRCIDD
jgi:hypothetical protein